MQTKQRPNKTVLVLPWPLGVGRGDEMEPCQGLPLCHDCLSQWGDLLFVGRDLLFGEGPC